MYEGNRRQHNEIYEFVTLLADVYRKTESILVLEIMCNFYETILKKAKFKDQRLAFHQTLKAINAPFYNGYFKKK